MVYNHQHNHTLNQDEVVFSKPQITQEEQEGIQWESDDEAHVLFHSIKFSQNSGETNS